MSSPNEPAKSLLPYLQRADELQKHEPLVAYYCRLYAMERGLKIPQSERTKTTNSLLISLINQLEKDKKSVGLSSDDNMHVEGFALNVFAKADKQDRAGRADLNTAKTFYAASIFFEILSQFGPSPPDIEQKQKYAVWKAADIGKAIKEGRNPTSGGPAGEDDLPIPSSGPSGSYDVGVTDANTMSHRTELDPSHDSSNGSIPHHSREVPHHPPPPRFYDNSRHEYSADVPPPPPSYSSNNLPPPTSRPDISYHHPYNHQTYHQDPPQHMPPHDYQNSDPHSAPAPPSTSFSSAPPYTLSSGGNSNKVVVQDPVRNPASSPAQNYHYDSSYQPRPEKIAEARKAAKNAMEALDSNEISTAVEYLKKSLELLTNPSFGQ